MAENSENILPENFVEDNLKEICHLISKNSDEEFLYNFFDCLFTNNEMTDFAKRWQLVKELDSGVTQREIARKYNMSLCKITRGSKMLKNQDSAFRILLDRLKEEK
ncbi:MAG: transcriptional regulator [Treponema sp.]|nr:transcriptional regulator [Treponema sp.]